ncbi:MAG: hypothetical protein ACXAEU_07050 [Candidatus Hodarchaeales archaeon]|jgi:hypothetical protein
MPIDREQWKHGRTERPLEERIMEYLENNSELAYTVDEIIDELGLLETVYENKDRQKLENLVVRQKTWNAIAFLKAKNQIESKTIKTERDFIEYYRINVNSRT